MAGAAESVPPCRQTSGTGKGECCEEEKERGRGKLPYTKKEESTVDMLDDRIAAADLRSGCGV